MAEEFDKAKKDDLRFDDLMYVSHKNMAHFQDALKQLDVRQNLPHGS